MQNEIIDSEISDYVQKYGSDFPLGIPSAYLSECQESDYLAETYPTQAFAYSNAAHLSQLRMRAVHPYIAAEGWNCSAEFSVNSMDGFYQLLNLNKYFSVDDWINSELSRAIGLGDWELLWSGKSYSLENQFDLVYYTEDQLARIEDFYFNNQNGTYCKYNFLFDKFGNSNGLVMYSLIITCLSVLLYRLVFSRARSNS